MPKYDYECLTCSRLQEVQHSMTDSPKIMCKECGSDCVKVILSVPACNMGWSMQAAGNAKKYWGSKPLVDITCPPSEGKPGFKIEGKRDREF